MNIEKEWKKNFSVKPGIKKAKKAVYKGNKIF